jgi:coenzyme PQQ precursor peptide PqqA
VKQMETHMTIAIKQLPASIQKKAAKWSSPRIVEVAVGLEINSYARAELN